MDAPSLVDELEKRSDWLRSKVFPLQAGLRSLMLALLLFPCSIESSCSHLHEQSS